jgi:hypothetical protein
MPARQSAEPERLVRNEDESQILLAVTRANAVWRVPLQPTRRAFAKACSGRSHSL